MTISACPRCNQPVRLPAAAAATAQVRCPICQAQFELGELLDTLPPELIVIDAVVVGAGTTIDDVSLPTPAAVTDAVPAEAFHFGEPAMASVGDDAPIEAESAGGSDDSGDLELEVPNFQFGDSAGTAVATEPARVSTTATAPRRAKKAKSPVRLIAEILFGGLLAFPLAFGILVLIDKDESVAPGWRKKAAAYIPWFKETSTEKEATEEKPADADPAADGDSSSDVGPSSDASATDAAASAAKDDSSTTAKPAKAADLETPSLEPRDDPTSIEEPPVVDKPAKTEPPADKPVADTPTPDKPDDKPTPDTPTTDKPDDAPKPATPDDPAPPETKPADADKPVEKPDEKPAPIEPDEDNNLTLINNKPSSPEELAMAIDKAKETVSVLAPTDVAAKKKLTQTKVDAYAKLCEMALALTRAAPGDDEKQREALTAQTAAVKTLIGELAGSPEDITTLGLLGNVWLSIKRQNDGVVIVGKVCSKLTATGFPTPINLVQVELPARAQKLPQKRVLVVLPEGLEGVEMDETVLVVGQFVEKPATGIKNYGMTGITTIAELTDKPVVWAATIEIKK